MKGRLQGDTAVAAAKSDNIKLAATSVIHEPFVESGSHQLLWHFYLVTRITVLHRIAPFAAKLLHSRRMECGIDDFGAGKPKTLADIGARIDSTKSIFSILPHRRASSALITCAPAARSIRATLSCVPSDQPQH